MKGRILLLLLSMPMLALPANAGAAPGFAPNPKQSFEGFAAINPPRADVPVGSLWINGFGPAGAPADKDNLETVRSLSSLTIDKNLQLALSAGLFDLLGIDPKLRDHYTARFSDLAIVRVKDLAKLSGPKGEPRIVEALKAGSVTISTDDDFGLNTRSIGFDQHNVTGSTTNDRSRTYSIEQELLKAQDRQQISRDTLMNVLRDWRYRSPEWAKLAVSTQKVWGAHLDAIDERWGETPVSVWNDPRMVAKVVAWRDTMAHTPRTADIAVTVLSRLLEWGRLRARVSINVATGIPALYSGGSRAEIIWTDEDLDAFCRAAISLDRPLLTDCLFLAAWTGMRLADLAAVTFDECGQEAIVRLALKRSRGRRRRAAIPILPQLRSLIDELRDRPRKSGVNTLLVNSFGDAWSPDALGKRFGEISREARIVHRETGEPDRLKHLHDVRGTYVTNLCRAGLTDRQIADIVAWSESNVARIRRTYVDDAAVVVALSRRINEAL